MKNVFAILFFIFKIILAYSRQNIFLNFVFEKVFLQIYFLLCICQMKNVFAILFFIFKIILAYSRQNDFSLLHLRNEKRFVKSSDWHKPAKVSLFYCTVP